MCFVSDQNRGMARHRENSWTTCKWSLLCLCCFEILRQICVLFVGWNGNGWEWDDSFVRGKTPKVPLLDSLRFDFAMEEGTSWRSSVEEFEDQESFLMFTPKGKIELAWLAHFVLGWEKRKNQIEDQVPTCYKFIKNIPRISKVRGNIYSQLHASWPNGNIHIFLGYQTVPTTFQKDLDRYSILDPVVVVRYVRVRSGGFSSKVFFFF